VAINVAAVVLVVGVEFRNLGTIYQKLIKTKKFITTTIAITIIFHHRSQVYRQVQIYLTDPKQA